MDGLGRGRRLIDYMLQQIQQFDSQGEGFAMQHGLSDSLQEMREVEEDLLTKILAVVPAERRLRGFSPEELAAALSDKSGTASRTTRGKRGR